MIESIEFKNFKALRDTTLPLGRFTLIVGPNGSGKSTALQALQVARKPGHYGFQELVSASQRSNSDASVGLAILIAVGERRFKKEIAWGSTGGLIKNNSLDFLESSLQGIELYALNEQAISEPVQLSKQNVLQRTGAGLSGVLDQLRDKNPERYEALNQVLGQWLPEFDRILFETTEGGKRAFMLRMREGHYPISAEALSQGTLLALTMLTIAYLPTPPSVVCLEEPDHGIHPRLLRDVQDALYRLVYPENYGETREPVQVIATTHSPYFLDLFRDHPEEVVLANKTDEGTKFERLSDQPNLNEILEDSHLGEVWYTGILGGVPAHA